MSESFKFIFFLEINLTNKNFFNDTNGQATITDYKTSPSFDSSGDYIPPSSSDFFNSSNVILSVYNVSPFVPIKNPILQNEIPLSSNQIAVYQYVYEITKTDFQDDSLQYKILDLLYLQNNLFQVFSTQFLTSTPCQTTVFSMMDIVKKYCNLSTNMSSILCSSKYLPFSMINYSPNSTINMNQSPCTNSTSFPSGSTYQSYTDCNTGWAAYCQQTENYQSSICQNFYNGSYNSNNVLDFSARNALETACQTVYENTPNKADLDQKYMNFCGCYLNFDTYQNFINENDLSDESLGPAQCWYLPCITSPFPPNRLSSVDCPTSDITNCIQKTYIEVADMGGGNIEGNNIVVNQTMKSCKSSTVNDASSQTSSATKTKTLRQNIQSNMKNVSPTTESDSTPKPSVSSESSFLSLFKITPPYNIASVVTLIVCLGCTFIIIRSLV